MTGQLHVMLIISQYKKWFWNILFLKLRMWQFLKICNLTCFDQLTHFIGNITVAINIGWHLSAVVDPGEAPPPLFLDQSEARRVNLFPDCPHPPPPLFWRSGSATDQYQQYNCREELRSVKSQKLKFSMAWINLHQQDDF